MFSALKKLAKGNDDRCTAPVPMSSSLQKKFSKGVHFNMKILIKGDRNVGKTCLLQRLQGGPFIEEYVPTDQIQVAPIHWTYKSSDHIVKVEVWEVVDKGRTKKKLPLGLKLDNLSANPANQSGLEEGPVLDATFLDVYKNATGVIVMLDITKPWTFEYVVKELSSIPADLPVLVLGNHCDMLHHRQVEAQQVYQLVLQARQNRSAPIRYTESSMRNGFGLRLLHRFLSVPFLRLQRTSLLEQLKKNQTDTEDIERELDDFQSSEECNYGWFTEQLAQKRREKAPPEPTVPRAPSIVLGGGKPIVPTHSNPLAQSLNPHGLKAHYAPVEPLPVTQTSYVSADLTAPKPSSNDLVASKTTSPFHSNVTSSNNNVSGSLDEFYAGALDYSFLEEPNTQTRDVREHHDSDSDEANIPNPMVANYQDDIDIAHNTPKHIGLRMEAAPLQHQELADKFTTQLSLTGSCDEADEAMIEDNLDVMWTRDSSIRRSPEGGEDPDIDLSISESTEKKEKKHKKKKSKDRDKTESSDKSEKKDRKHKHKKSKSDKKEHPQLDLLARPIVSEVNQEDYDSI